MNADYSTAASAPSKACGAATDRSETMDVARSIAIIVTSQDGSIEAWNRGAQDLFGYSEADVLGKNISLVAMPRYAMAESGFGDHLDGAAHTGWYRHRNGTRVFCTEASSYLPRHPSPMTRRARYLCDATALHERYEALHRKWTEQQARYGEVVSAEASKDRCLALISHELKQPLTTILMGVERLLELTFGIGIGRIHDDLLAIRGATRRQAKIVDDLLELSRIRTGKMRLDPALVNVGDLVRAVATAIAEDTPDRRIHICIDDASANDCIADAIRLEQIVSNLLHNAIKFSEIGGSIEVCVRSADGFTNVSVADDGMGICKEFLPHVFSMFGQEMRAHPSASEGLGIGLALVRELAKAHGGGVNVRSDGPNRGSSFTVWLPSARHNRQPSLPQGQATSLHS